MCTKVIAATSLPSLPSPHLLQVSPLGCRQSVSQSQPVLQMTTTTTNQNIILCFIRLLLLLQLLHSAPFIVVGLTFNIDCKLEPINRGQSNCTGQLSSTSYLIVLCRRHHLLRTYVPHSPLSVRHSYHKLEPVHGHLAIPLVSIPSYPLFRRIQSIDVLFSKAQQP